MQDLKSQLALMLRRKMLLTLSDKDFADPKHGEEMLVKYGDTLMPREEIEWFGLSVRDALLKHKLADAQANDKLPLKYELAKKLLEDLKNKTPEEDSKYNAPSRRYVYFEVLFQLVNKFFSLVLFKESSQLYPEMHHNC